MIILARADGDGNCAVVGLVITCMWFVVGRVDYCFLVSSWLTGYGPLRATNEGENDKTHRKMVSNFDIDLIFFMHRKTEHP